MQPFRYLNDNDALLGVLRIQGDGLFIFRDFGGESITFWGFREQGAEEKLFGELGRNWSFFFQGAGSKDPSPGGPR